MSGAYGPADEAESSATIQAALDAGVGLVDTGGEGATDRRLVAAPH
jgi:aryl-alcohol dehydrogenase-like predicted oxidoreductase